MSVNEIQDGNRSWWTKNPMTYDWKKDVGRETYSAEWFDIIDRRFIYGARLFATDKAPFDRIMPLERLKGKRVLEIGCGMGLHSELLARAEANLSSVDLSDKSIEATQKRFALKNLSGDIRQADAEHLPFDNATFDFVWSWGVIHHSSRTGRIVREISRVLKPDGECRIMVYSRSGMIIPVIYLKEYLLKGKFLKQSFEEVLYRTSDGFSARFYVPEQFADMVRSFFDEVSYSIMGQDADVLPLPRLLRAIAVRAIPEKWLKQQQSKRGHFLFVTASKPV